MGKYKIPFDEHGDQLHYTYDEAPPFNLPDDDPASKGEEHRNIPGHPISWKKNFKFHDTLQLDGMDHGQSAKFLLLSSTTTGSHFTMFVRDAIDVIRNAEIDHGKITATRMFIKRGQNYGVTVMENSSPV